MRRFELWRAEDKTGISGTGMVAHGVEFDNGQCVMQWQTHVRSVCIYESSKQLIEIHGHNGASVLRWID